MTSTAQLPSRPDGTQRGSRHQEAGSPLCSHFCKQMPNLTKMSSLKPLGLLLSCILWWHLNQCQPCGQGTDMWTPPGYGRLGGVGGVGSRGCEVITEPLIMEAGQLNPPCETQRRGGGSQYILTEFLLCVSSMLDTGRLW